MSGLDAQQDQEAPRAQIAQFAQNRLLCNNMPVAMACGVNDVMRAGAELRYDTAVLHRDGSRIPVESIVHTMHPQAESLRMTIVRDIRNRLEAQARIHHLAHHDPLPG
jgi:hypothetical protein